MCIQDNPNLYLVAGEQTKGIVFTTLNGQEQHCRIAIRVRKVTNLAESPLTLEATLHADCRTQYSADLQFSASPGRWRKGDVTGERPCLHWIGPPKNLFSSNSWTTIGKDTLMWRQLIVDNHISEKRDLLLARPRQWKHREWLCSLANGWVKEASSESGHHQITIVNSKR